MHIDDIMQRVDSLRGMEDFKALCHRLHLAAQNASGRSFGRIPLPNLIFAAAPGCGVTLHLHLLTELLKALKLLQFTGEEECFEWSFAHEAWDFDRFLLRVKAAGGFYGQFRGVIGLNMGDMPRSDTSIPAMNRLMEYVEARQGKIIFVFILPDTTNEQTLHLLLARFASITPAELIRMSFPTEEAQSYIVDQLTQSGCRITDDADRLLRDVVVQLSHASAFEGYQTLLNLTDEIIWRKLSHSKVADACITEDDLAFIFAKDGYCDRLSHYSHRTHRSIGFGTASED